MNNLERRVGRLEGKLGVKTGPRDLTRDVIITNVDFSDGEEAPIFPGVWANVYGEPLTSEEIQKLREEHQEAGHE